MTSTSPSLRNHLTLALCTLLHAFTHAYGTLLVPLYLLITADLKLGAVWKASLIVTIYGVINFLLSYPAGVLADRMNRKALLGIGLLGNACAITLIGLTRQYEMLIVLAVLAGLFATLFHPAANALATAHYPKSPGMAIGVLGMGSGLGFFAGPQYAGWRAQIAGWQRPCIEMGIFGIVCGIIFLLVAKEVTSKHDRSREACTAGRRTARSRPGTGGRPVHARFLRRRGPIAGEHLSSESAWIQRQADRLRHRRDDAPELFRQSNRGLLESRPATPSRIDGGAARRRFHGGDDHLLEGGLHPARAMRVSDAAAGQLCA